MKDSCEKYELAITNYVIGEKIDMPQQALFDHLAQCPSCQGDLRNWRATYATMRAREYDARPEVKQRTQAFIKELVAGGAAAESRCPADASGAAGAEAGSRSRHRETSGPTYSG